MLLVIVGALNHSSVLECIVGHDLFWDVVKIELCFDGFLAVRTGAKPTRIYHRAQNYPITYGENYALLATRVCARVLVHVRSQLPCTNIPLLYKRPPPSQLGEVDEDDAIMTLGDAGHEVGFIPHNTTQHNITHFD